jgi:hypothetical protein
MFSRTVRAFVIGALAILAAVVARAQSGEPDVRSFATPEAAVAGLIAALQAPTLQPLIEIFSRPVLESVPPEERRSDAQRRAAGDRLAAEPTTIEYENADRTRARAIVGREGFRLPIPLVRGDKGWVFDGIAGVAEMNQQRISVNEANAILALHAFARAQEMYRERDRDGNGFLEYAQRIRGTEDRLDGLVNTSADVPGPASSLLNEAFALAEGKPGDPQHHPAGGYGYAILTAQGPSAEGGARSYLIAGHLRDGYAILAWPTRPGETGESTFAMNQAGTIYEQEFGDRTLDVVRKISAFDPDEKWTRVEE